LTWFGELLGYLEQGGFVMLPLLALALLLWFGIGYRVMFVRRGTTLETRQLLKRFAEEGERRTTGYLDEAVRRGVYVVSQHSGDVRRYLEDEFFLLEAELRKFRTLVRTVVIVAPLLGLLGTVIGMIEMFQSLGDQNLYSQSGGVAQGISQALFTTQLGLVIAIPGMLIGGLIDRREHKIREDIEQLKDLLSQKPDIIRRKEAS